MGKGSKMGRGSGWEPVQEHLMASVCERLGGNKTVHENKSRCETQLWLSLLLSLGKPVSLSEPRFPHLEMEILVPS